MSAGKITRSKRLALIDMPTEQKVRVWTFQRLGAWEAAQKRGYWTGDRDFVEDEIDREYNCGWLPQYDWMREQMAHRIDGYSGDYPMWGYLRRVNLRQYAYQDEPTVLVVAEVPRGRMLISDYDLWHMPLNRSVCMWTEAEYDAFYERNKWSKDISPEVMATWDRIFDLRDRTGKDVISWCGQPDYLQACVDRIHLDEIVQVRPVTGRVGRNR